MRVPLSWLADYVDLGDTSPRAIAGLLTRAGLQVEKVDELGADIDNVVVAKVLDVEELSGFKKPIRWVTLTDGADRRQVICGATNFAAGDLVAYARPPATLPGGFRIDKRAAYGRESDGMICSARELALGDDHSGIVVLGRGPAATAPLGADVVDVLGLRDAVLDISVNPDRGYALSVRGVAREVATALGVAFRDPADVNVPVASKAGYDVRVEDGAGCDRYVARVITGIDPTAASPQWLQRRLTLAGMRPISLAVDVTNHVMLDVGQPLHAFDRAKLSGPIVVRRAVAGERLRTLDGVDRELDPRDLVIADDSGPIALAGVMGGAATEVDASTTDIVLEAAHFDPVSVAYTARRHRLGSEASRRFERGVDDDLAAAAATLAAALLGDLGGALPDAAVTDVDTREPRPVIELDPALPGKLAGVDYDLDRTRSRLVDVGCQVESGPASWRVTPPSWRPDLRRPVDLVEEVVRLEGYERLPSTVPAAPAGRGLTRPQRQRRVVGRALAGAGYAEVLTYPFVGEPVADALLLPPDDERRSTVRLANPVSDEEPLLRATLLPGLLQALARNVGRGATDVGLYEIGPVFRAVAGDLEMPPPPPPAARPPDDVLEAMQAALPAQPLHVAVALTGARERSGWWGAGRESCWADAVESARLVAASVGLQLDVQAAETPPWHPGRCAALSHAGTVIGHAGELHPRVIESFDLPPRAVAMELALDPLLAASPATDVAPAISAYPPATFDLALVVPADVPAAAVTAELRDALGPLLESLRLFDVYAGEQIGAGRRSLAFTIRLRAADRTLTSDEVAEHRARAVAAAAERFGATLRGG